jgi:hypothetical protein
MKQKKKGDVSLKLYDLIVEELEAGVLRRQIWEAGGEAFC